jgi:hypothetical protein
MGPLDFANHVLNFVAPAVFVGFFLALTGPLALGVRTKPGAWMASGIVNSLAGCCALAAGLWFFGNDGKMGTYGALLLACALSQLAYLRWASR